MGFEVMLRGTHRASPREICNPFTGEAQLHSPLVMNETELRAALAVVAQHGGRLDEHGGGLLRLDGAALQFAGLNEEGDLLEVFGDLRVACGVLFEMAAAGQMAIVTDGGDGFVASNSALRALQLEDELGSPVTGVESAEALAAALTAECDTARDYTERALRGS